MKPLAYRLRPNSLKEVLGNNNLLNNYLFKMIEKDKYFSFVLFGEPGTGKTSIAEAFINDADMRSRVLNGATLSKADMKEAIEFAKLHGRIILIIDEIHRLNKANQDYFLPFVENGLIILIGLTTTNPYYSLNNALRSRLHLFEVEKLNDDEIFKALKDASKKEQIHITNDALKYIVRLTNHDIRYSYNVLEMLSIQFDKKITLEDVKNAKLTTNIRGVDDNEHYNLLSALQKAIRGSDVNASLYYLGRLLFIGDIDSIIRRLTVIVYEDIGLANPILAIKLNNAISSFREVGMPEGRIILSTIVIEMALSPKSNTSYLAINLVMEDIEKGNVQEIPDHIKPNSMDYKYPHNYKNHLVKQTYLPSDLENRNYYIPSDLGYEKKLKEIEKYLKDFKESNTDE